MACCYCAPRWVPWLLGCGQPVGCVLPALLCCPFPRSDFVFTCRCGQLTVYCACCVIVVCSHVIACRAICYTGDFPVMGRLVRYCVAAMTFAIGFPKWPGGM